MNFVFRSEVVENYKINQFIQTLFKNIDKTDLGAQRKSHDWYMVANKMCEQNYHNLFNPNYKSFTWDDVLKKLDRDRI